MSQSIVLARIEEKSFHYYSHQEGADNEANRVKSVAEVEEYLKGLLDLLARLGIHHTFSMPEGWRESSYRHSVGSIDVVLKQQHFFDLLEAGCNVKLISRHELKESPQDFTNAVEAAERVIERMESIAASFSERSFNDRCDVHVPGLGLLSINRTMLLEDCCTDELARALGNGWRIIAACPQPDQRRPDYILGKHDFEFESSDARASRSSLD